MSAPMTRTEFVVRITKGRIGYPVGVWVRLMYRAMADKAASTLRAHGIEVVVEEEEVRHG